MDFSLISPIPESFVDDNNLFTDDSDFNIVPYYGDDESTSHCWLELLQAICALTPSIKACKKDFKKYCFTGIDIVAKSTPGFMPDMVDGTEEVMDLATKQGHIETLKALGIHPLEILKHSKKIESDWIDSGNLFLRIRIINSPETGTIVEFKPLPYTQVAFKRNKRYEIDKEVYYTKKWSEEYWEENEKPDKYPVTPYLAEEMKWNEFEIKATKTTVKETVVHVMNQNDDSDYYGRPDLLAVLDWAFVEINYGQLVNKISNTEILTKTILAFQSPDPATMRGGAETIKDAFKNMMKDLRIFMTNKGSRKEAKSMVGIRYPYSGTPPTPIDLEVNRNEDYQESSLEQAKNFLYSNLGWSPILTGAERQKSGLGSNLLLNTFVTYYNSTIIPKQMFYADIWNWILCEVLKETNNIEIDWGIQFTSLAKKVISDMSELDNPKDESNAEPNNE